MNFLLEKLVEASANRSIAGNFFYIILAFCLWLSCFITAALLLSYVRDRIKNRFWRKIRIEEVIFFVLGGCAIALAFIGACLVVASVAIAIRRGA